MVLIDLLLNLGAGLASDLIKSRRTEFVEERQIKAAYDFAFTVMTEKLPEKLIKWEVQNLEDQWNAFLEDPNIHDLFFDLAIRGDDPELKARLASAYKKHFAVDDPEPINYFIDALHAGLRIEAGDSLTTIVMLGDHERQYTLSQEILHHQQQMGVKVDEILKHVKPRTRACPPPPRNPEFFGGREQILIDLTEKLTAGETVAITAINGIGGMGKTTIAAKLSHDLYEKVFSAVLWADVTRNPEPISLLSRWAQYGDPEFTPGDTPLNELPYKVKHLLDDLIRDECGGRVLVVLDDVWEASKEVARLLQKACPQDATILVTTRSGGVAVDLCGDSTLQVEAMDDTEGVALLRLYLKSADEAALTALTDALGGHPLALTLAAKRILKMQDRLRNKALIDHTAHYQAGLPAGSKFDNLKLAEGEKKEENLHKALAHSYEDLSDEQQWRFRQMGILAHDEPFDVAMLAALWELPEDQASDAAEDLRLLALLDADETGDDWYKQHPLLHSYARALLNERADEHDFAFNRYADWMTQVARQFNTLPPEQWDVLNPHIPHIHEVGDALVKLWQADETFADVELAGRAEDFAYYIPHYLRLRRQVRRIEWLEMGLAASRKTENQRNQSLFLNELGLVWDVLGEKHKALDFYEQILLIDRDVGGEAVTLNNIGAVWNALGEEHKALDYLEQALMLSRAVGNSGSEAATLNNLGSVYRSLGENQKALDYLEQALTLLRAVGNSGGEAATLNNIATINFQNGDLEGAANSLRQIITIDRAIGNVVSEVLHLYNLAYTLNELQQFDEAIALVTQSIAILKRYNLPQDVGGNTLAEHEQFLARLQQRRDGQ